MNVLRTPESRFANLPDYPFEPRHFDVEPGLRLHCVDEGDRRGRSVLMLHGEPTWSYLYRRMIPAAVAAGLRVLAPHLIGFGRSDKPFEGSDYSYAGQPHTTLRGGHFVQEDDPEGFAQVIVDLCRR